MLERAGKSLKCSYIHNSVNNFVKQTYFTGPFDIPTISTVGIFTVHKTERQH